MADQVFKGKIIRGASHIHIYHEKRHCDVWMWGHLGGGSSYDVSKRKLRGKYR